jgi:transcription elongation factor GreA
MGNTKYVTREGLQKLKDELHLLISVERPSISQQIAEARDKGDLSENAEYSAAKDAQGMLELKISKLMEIISNAKVVDESSVDTSKVLIFNTVKLKDLKTNKITIYTILPENEANIRSGKISVNSPIAKGLLGKVVGDKVEINIPVGKINYEIIEITR